jgi:uncharacterized membrane protein HdeD (DUF308 family)
VPGHHGPADRHDPTGHHAASVRLAGVTVVLGVAAVLLAVFDFYTLGIVVGIAGIAVGLFSQMNSESTEQRWFDVFGIGASAVGFFISLLSG